MKLKKCFEEEETTLSLVKVSVFFCPDVGIYHVVPSSLLTPGAIRPFVFLQDQDYPI
jgi:hypothetical protein